MSPGPEDITIAVSTSQACTARKSRVAPSAAASGMAHCVQCAPPSEVLSTVPPAPLAQAVVPSTEMVPSTKSIARRSAVVPEFCISQGGLGGAGDWAAARAETARSRTGLITCMAGSINPLLAETPDYRRKINLPCKRVSRDEYKRRLFRSAFRTDPAWICAREPQPRLAIPCRAAKVRRLRGSAPARRR